MFTSKIYFGSRTFLSAAVEHAEILFLKRKFFRSLIQRFFICFIQNSIRRIQQERFEPNQLVQRPTPTFEMREESKAKLQQLSIKEKYNNQLKIAVEKVKKSYAKYREKPESHPDYAKEWKLFWARRFKELLESNEDPNNYDYKPEWIEFWLTRMEELHDSEVQNEKETLRKKLGLTADDEKTEKLEIQYELGPQPFKQQKLSEKENNQVQNIARSKANQHRSTRRDLDQGSFEAEMMEKMNLESVNILSVCEFLLTLNSDLGILAESMLDLQAKAIAIERLKPNSAAELLLDDNNRCVFETVKEKFNGLLSRHSIPSEKFEVLNTAVRKIKTLLNEVDSKHPTFYANEVLSSTSQVQKTLENEVDAETNAKKVIAEALMEQLVLEGRSDLSTEELEALIENFMNGEEEEMEVVHEAESNVGAKKSDDGENSNLLENLADDDLQTLLRNFTELTDDEQSHLIAFLKNIEETDPKRVENLKKYMNVGDDDDMDYE